MRPVHLFFSFSLLLFGCFSQPSQHQTITNRTVTNSNAELLDNVIFDGTVYISSRIPLTSKVGVVNIHSTSVNLSNYIIDSTVMHLVNTENFIVVERSGLDVIQREQQYQLSGEVSESMAISIGQQLGIQYIITGSIIPLGNNYSLQIKITDVQTAQILGTRIFVKPDNTLLSLVNPPTQPLETPQQVIMGDVNITNNNTTTIFGDVHINRPQGNR